MHYFNKILIANRGEIAARIIRTAQHMGIATVAVYSEADRESLHVSTADEAVCIGEMELIDTYLNIPKIIDAALRTGADAIHPGYGFLAENPEFVKKIEEAGLTFIGPNSEAIRMMGNKIEARQFVKSIDVPVTDGAVGNEATLLKKSKEIKFPILVKAAAGGGGKGMRIVKGEDELKEAIESTSREAAAYFGDGTVYIEKYVEQPRHIEMQVLADKHGNVIHLFERECSIQRRYQKIIEEAPSPTLTGEVRQKMGEAAVRIASEIGYTNAGTIEFLVDKDLNFFFLEMNTRIQVEHPVTEMTTGVDLVEEQIHVAAGEKLRYQQKELKQNGHAIECRIYAEDPSNNFLPSPGQMTLYHEPAGINIRLDAGIDHATEVKGFFDPMISKLIIWDHDREAARKRMIDALKKYVIQGIETNIPFLLALLQHKAYIQNEISTKFCDEHTNEIIGNIGEYKKKLNTDVPLIAYMLYSINQKTENHEHNIWHQIGYWRDLMEIRSCFEDADTLIRIEKTDGKQYRLQFEGKTYSAEIVDLKKNYIRLSIDHEEHEAWLSANKKLVTRIEYNGSQFIARRKDLLIPEEAMESSASILGKDKNKIVSPMPGKVIKISVEVGQEVKAGETLLIVEAMKMENSITAPYAAIIEKVNVSIGDAVDGSSALVVLQEETEQEEA